MDENGIRIAAGIALALVYVSLNVGYLLMQRREGSARLAMMVAKCIWDVRAVERRRIFGQWRLKVKLTFEHCFEVGGWQSFFIYLYFTRRHPDYEAVGRLKVGERVQLVSLEEPLKGVVAHRVEAHLRLQKINEEEPALP